MSRPLASFASSITNLRDTNCAPRMSIESFSRLSRPQTLALAGADSREQEAFEYGMFQTFLRMIPSVESGELHPSAILGLFRIPISDVIFALLSEDPSEQPDEEPDLFDAIIDVLRGDLESTAPPPAPQMFITRLPTKTIKKSDFDGEDEPQCTICLEDVAEGTEVTLLPCKHWFHPKCVNPWLRHTNSCPYCRQGLDLSTLRVTE